MVTLKTDKVSMAGGYDGHVGTEDGSEGYENASDDLSGDDESIRMEYASDYEGMDPKEAPGCMFFGETECRVEFQLKGDAVDGITHVCGGVGSTCARSGHKNPEGIVAPPGIYDTVKTARRVDGIRSTHRSAKVYNKEQSDLKAVREAKLSILKVSPGYKANLKKVAVEFEEDESIKSGSNFSDDRELWESVEAELATLDERKPAAKATKSLPTPDSSPRGTVGRQARRCEPRRPPSGCPMASCGTHLSQVCYLSRDPPRTDH